MMKDLDSEFRALDLIEPPLLGDEIAHRAASSGLREPPLAPPGRRVVAAIVAFTIFALAAFGLWRVFARVGADIRPGDNPLASIPSGWTQLPQPPEVHGGAAWVWTGDELLTWGGALDDPKRGYPLTSSGYSFDPRDYSWAPLPDAPTALSNAHAVWTGAEAIFVGGDDGEGPSLDGLAFDPLARTWRPILAAPLVPRHPAVTVWTGDEVIVWGGGDRDDPATNRSGAAYDPRRDTWRRIADAPLGLNLASGMWTGRELIVFGSLLNGRNLAETEVAVGAAYDPVADRWRPLPPSELSPQATSAVWVGDRMMAWDEPTFQEYLPEGDRWTDPSAVPFAFNECYPDSVVIPPVVFAWFCGDAAVFDIASSEWERIHGGLTEPTLEAYENQYRLFRFADLVPAGVVVFVAAEGITIDEDGLVCYGCPGSPTALWTYRHA